MLLNDEELLRIERAYCAQSLAQFAERAWHVLEPATPLKWGWALDAICEHLEAVTSGEIKRLLINVPPGPMRADSMVETGRGLLRLDAVVVGDTVLTHKGRYRKVEAVHDQGVLPILKITTHSGRETFAAPSHPYLTPTGWVAAGDLKIGDCLAVVNPQEPRNDPSKITPEEARFIGYIVGDGSVTHSPNFVNADRDVIDDFVSCAESLGMVVSETRSKTFWKIGIRGARPLLEKHGLIGANSYTKRIPVAVMNGTKEVIQNFIGAYWSCDGGINVRPTRNRGSIYRAYATTVSEGLAKDLILALGMIGIESRLRKKERNLETAAQPGGIYKSFSIEVQKETMTARVVSLPGLCERKNTAGIECRRDFDSVLWCDPVVSIESDQDAHCMCLTVEDDHSFTCAGIAVHNCMKSLLTGVIWPAWEWGPRNMQAMRYLGTAHKQDLAVRDSTKCRRLIQSEWYQKLWPVELTGDQNAKTKFENIKTGFRESMSFTSLTGSRADRVLCFPYDQCIMTENGMLKIGDIVENKINVRILGANKDSLSWQKITRYDKNPKNQIVKIATKRGSIECTADHPIYVSGRGFVEARRLRKGDRIKGLISQDMRELREIISTSTKAVDWKGSGNMLCRLPMGAKSSTSTIKRNIGLSGVWGNGLSQPITQSQKQIGFLWPEVRGKAHDRGNESVVFRRESCKGMRCLQQDIFCEQNRIISASYMQQNMWEFACMGQIWKTAARNSMRKLCKYFQANIQIFKVLFNGVQKCRPFKANVIKWKPEICTRTIKFSISTWVEKWTKTKNKRSRWELLQSMWNFWRNSIDSSYRLHQRKPRCDEFDISVREMSRINASEGFEKTRGIEDVAVESVEFLENEEVTYNLCVEHDHVYFPGGFLAHNCDDPLSADDANSEAALRAAEITFTESLPTRVNNDESAIVVIMQRLHEKDTSGIILDRKLGYTHLCLPMRYETERKCTTSIGFSDPRTKDGELLFPERFSEKQVKELETILGSYAAAGQLQQRPAPREGGMFKRSWFNVVRAVPANTQFVRGWDLAATNGAGDWTVGVKIGRMPSGRFLIAGVARDQLSSAGVERLIVNTASQDGLECRISLPQDPGQAGKAQASYLVQKLAGYNVTTSTESGDKVTRASPMAAQAEAGNIDILEGEWNDTFLNELSVFPAGSKDQTDAASRAFNELVMASRFNLTNML